MVFNREMQRVCRGGTLGKILYAEGEYNHPFNMNDDDFRRVYMYHPKHWRHFLPRTYYITHSLGPVMCATGATPKTVTAFASFAPHEDDVPSAEFVGDRAAIITTQNDDGSIFRVTGCCGFGAHHNSYRICGTNGQIDNLRGMGEKIMLRYNSWSIPEGKEEINCYDAQWNDKDEELIKSSGHGGGDYITARMFLECLEENREPEHPFNLKAAIAMSSTAILAQRSVLEGGKPYAIPDFDREEDCQLYENDRLSPFYGPDGSAPTLPCCSHPDYHPSENQMKKYLEKMGLNEE
jgi:predicted dehydrogenase